MRKEIKVFGIAALIGMLATLCAYAIVAYGVGSLVTSGVKSFKGECDKRYGIESVVDGGWFCEVKK